MPDAGSNSVYFGEHGARFLQSATSTYCAYKHLLSSAPGKQINSTFFVLNLQYHAPICAWKGRFGTQFVSHSKATGFAVLLFPTTEDLVERNPFGFSNCN